MDSARKPNQNHFLGLRPFIARMAHRPSVWAAHRPREPAPLRPHPGTWHGGVKTQTAREVLPWAVRASGKVAATRCKSAGRSAGFQACCIADFQIGGRPELAGASQVRNLRHSRFGNLRYDFVNGPALGCGPGLIFSCARAPARRACGPGRTGTRPRRAGGTWYTDDRAGGATGTCAAGRCSSRRIRPGLYVCCASYA